MAEAPDWLVVDKTIAVSDLHNDVERDFRAGVLLFNTAGENATALVYNHKGKTVYQIGGSVYVSKKDTKG